MFKLTYPKSKAVPPEVFTPFLPVRSEEIVCPCNSQNTFTPTAYTSQASTQEELRQSGRLLLSLGSSIPTTSLFVVSGEAERKFGKFVEKDNCIFYLAIKNGNPTEVLLANFVFTPFAWQNEINIDGSVSQYLLGHVKATEKIFTFAIRKEEYFAKFLTKLKAEELSLHLNSECRNAEALFREYLSSALAAVGTLPIKNIYAYAGWGEDRRYHHGGMPDCKASRILPDANKLITSTAFHEGMSILDIGDLNITLPVLLQSVSGVMAKLFEDAGLPLQYLFCLVGPSGSKKTSLSKVAFCNFNVHDVINFTSTERAIELHAEECHDSVFVLDDLSSVKDKIQLNKLENFLRKFCDGAGRKKSIDGGKNLVSLYTRCSVVITAESLIEGLQQSSILRLLQVPVNKSSINNERLGFFQHDQHLARFNRQFSVMEKFISSFVMYLESNYIEVVTFITTYSPPCLDLEADRHTRVYRTLCTIAQVLLKWGCSSGAILKDATSSLFEAWLPILQRLVIFNDNLGRLNDPIKNFLTIVNAGIIYGKISIAQNKEKFLAAPSNFNGFWENAHLYLDPNHSFNYAASQFHNTRSTTLTDILSKLRDLGLSVGYVQKNHKGKTLRLVRVKNKDLKMLCLDWLAVQNYINDGDMEVF